MWRRSCLECRLAQHEFCLRKRAIGKRCRCSSCWGDGRLAAALPARRDVSQELPRPQFVFFAYDGAIQGRPVRMLLSSVTLQGVELKRVITGWQRGWGGARLPVYRTTLTATVEDFAQQQDENFPELLRKQPWYPG